MRTHTRALFTVGLLLLGGCARMKPGLGFDGVGKSVSERTGMRVHWNNGTDADREVGEAIGSMLSRELSVEEAVQIALLNNHRLQAVYEDLNLAQADIVQAGLLKNPVFDAQVRFGEAGVGTAFDLAIMQDFVSLLYIPMQKGRAEAAFEGAKLRVTGAVLDLAGEVRSAYYEYQAAEQTREMRGTVLEAVGASYELGKRIRDAGNSRELDLLNLRAQYEQARLDLAGAEAAADAGRERLNALMGLWGRQTGWRITARLPALPGEEVAVEGLERRAIESSLDLQIERSELELASRAMGLAGPLSFLADSSVGFAANRELEGPWSFGPAFAIPIPLFDQGQGRAGAAQARLRKASERYTALAVELRSRVRAEASATESARERAEYYEKVMLPLRSRIVEETQLLYNAMQVSAFQLFQARRDEIDAGNEYILALRDYWLARSRLDQVLSGRITAASGPERGWASASTDAGGEGGHQ